MTTTEEDNAALRTRIRDLEAALMIGNDRLRATFHVSDQMRDILGVLLSLQVVTTDILESRLDLATEPKVAMHRLRQALAPYGIPIESANRVGYWLSEESKAKIGRLLEAKDEEISKNTQTIIAAAANQAA